MNSLEYWRKREDENTRLYHKDERQVEREIEEIYQNTLDNVEKEIYSFYAKYASKEGITINEAKKRVTKADIAEYEKKAEKYVKLASQDRAKGTDANAHIYFSERANEEMALYNLTMKVNRLEMLKSKIGLELAKGNAEAEAKMQKQLEKRSLEEMKRQAGILGESINNQLKKANAIVKGSFHNATFSDRIWANMDMLKAKIDTLLQQGMIQGKGARQLASNIRKEFNVTTFQAERLMRTELARVQIETQKESYIRNGFEEYEFIANSGCCDTCQALNGKIFKVKKMMPGENAAPIHPNCRCSTAPYEDSEDYEAWLDFLDKGGTTEEYNQFKKTGINPLENKTSQTSNFTPAKTIEEAEQYAEQFVEKGGFKIGKKNINYSGISVDHANTINKTLNDLFHKTKIKKFSSIEVFGKGQKKMWSQHKDVPMCTSNFGNLLINKEICKSSKTLDKYNKEGNDAFKYVIENMDKLSASDRKIAEAYKKAGRSLVGDSLQDMIIHESGHHVSYMTDVNRKLSDYSKGNWKEYAQNISGYANHTFGEYVAESWLAYNKGEIDILDSKLINIFDEVMKL